VLSVKGAWETVQHTACGSLSDELRNQACATLRTLASGAQLPGGASLPMPDEALRMVLRHQRHELKSQWEERAVGDEVVRKEYWQELKVSLEREEAVVKQQNARVADQRLVEALRFWQEWLDDDSGSRASGERVAKDLGTLMDAMPSAPLSRTARAAIEAAGRRVAAARSAVTATTEQSEVARNQAVAFGEKAAQQHGAARTELESKKKEILEHQEALKDIRQNHQRTGLELESHKAELGAAKDQLQKLLAQVDEGRDREHDYKSKHVDMVNKDAALRSDFDNIQQAYAKAQADHMTSERLAQAAGDTHEAEKRRLEAEIAQLRAQANDKINLERELEQTRGKANEHDRLSKDLEQAKNNHSTEIAEKSLLAADKARIEAELQHHRTLQATEKSHLDAELEQLRAEVREKGRVEAELNEAKLQLSEKTRLQYDLDHHRNMVAEKDDKMRKLENEAQRVHTLQAELNNEAFEKRNLASQLEFAKKQTEDLSNELAQERTRLQGENERTRTDHVRMVEETRQRLEDERKAHSNVLDAEKHRLLDNERNAGVLEGKFHTLDTEAKTLRDKVNDLQQKDIQHARETEQLKQDLEKEKAEKVLTAQKLQQQADEYEKEKREHEADAGKGGSKKCCVVM